MNQNKKIKIILVLVAALLVIVGTFSAAYLFYPKGPGLPAPVRYSQTWRLVPEKISASALIKVYLPKGISRELLVKSAVFQPAIEGQWIEQSSSFNFIQVAYGQSLPKDPEYALFQPSAPLTQGRYYAVTVDLGQSKTINADFLAVEDPKIDAIFPKGDMEAPEDSKITIAFNRPMVALSTLDLMEPQDLRVQIVPQTDGKWKWISTNTLQFIPTRRLQRSTNYTVKIAAGLKSMDGLSVAPAQASFKTRNLRYLNEKNQNIDDVVYDQPARIYFNQPLDLQKTAAQIKLIDVAVNAEIPFTAAYKDNTQNGAVAQSVQDPIVRFFSNIYASLISSKNNRPEDSEKIDESIIEIYPKQDKYNRAKIWNSQNQYKIVISKAYPKEGDIAIDSEKIFEFRTTSLISGFFAQSARSRDVSSEMFDPQGQLGITFYEPININSSSFGASVPIVKKEYGQKCDDPDFNLSDLNCKKIEDKNTVLLTFDKDKTAAGQTINLSLDNIVSAAGQTINAAPIKKDLFVYKPFNYYIGRSTLSAIYLCSNNPLSALEKKDYRSHLDASLDFEIFSWSNSWRRDYNYDDSPCKPNEFETMLGVGLIPQSDYRLDFNITDAFGQQAFDTFNIATPQMSRDYVAIFAMQQNTSVTTPGKTKLVYGAKNITYVNTLVCKVDALAYYNEENGKTHNYQNDTPRSNCFAKKINLSERYWANNYFDLDVAASFDQQLGYYIVILSHPLYQDYRNTPDYLVNYITVTGLSAAQKLINPEYDIRTGMEKLNDEQLVDLKNLYWISDSKTLAPISGARIKLYAKGEVVADTKTNAEGVGMSNPVSGIDFAVVDYEGDSTIIYGYDVRLNWASDAYNVKRSYIYTDRPIYRPGDKINVKGILRLGYDGNYQMWSSKKINVRVTDPGRDTPVSQNVELDDYGAFETSFDLDKAAPLGNYEICVDGTYECATFSLREYAPAAFKVGAQSAKDEYTSKENLKINVGAAYYFGVPLENAKVEYTISSQNYYFDRYQGDGYYNFGFYDDCDGYYCYGDKFIGRGSLTLDAAGKGVIDQSIDLQKIAGADGYARSRIIVFDITATNSMGQSVSTQKSIIVHSGDYYLGVKTDPSFTPKNRNVNISVKTVGQDGKLTAANGAPQASIYRVDWIYSKRQEVGGAYNYNWTKKRELAKKINLNRGGTGSYSADMSLDKEGEYEVDVTSTDKRGNNILSRDYLYVYGDGSVSIRHSNDTELTIKTNRDKLNVGDTGQIIIESPFPKAKALIAIERGKIFDYQIVDVNGSLYNYDFKIAREYAPNVYVSVLLQSADPAVKFGSKEFTIDSAAHKINIEVIPSKKVYQPGEKVRLDIRARDNNGNPVSSELSVAVADLSVLALEGNPKKDPLIFFYNGFPLTVSTSSNIKNFLEKIDINSLTKGGGGANAADEAGQSSEKVRGDFRDTALWQGKVNTDSAGNARVEFNLSDNLTTWQAEVVGVSRDTKVGAGYAEFMSRKDLMVVPLKPRFIIPGDEFYIGSNIFNQSAAAQNVQIAFASDTLQFTGKDKSVNISLKAGESKTVYFAVKAPYEQTNGIHNFTVSAKTDSVSDAIKLPIPVKPNLTYEAVATANYVTADNAVEVIYLPANVSRQQGQLDVKSSATLAVFLSDALNSLIGYPYGCTEQISSRLKAMAIVKAGLNVPNLADKFKLREIWIDGKQYSLDDLIGVGLAKIYNNQAPDGGFGLWSKENPSFYLTLEAVDMLNTLKLANIPINDRVRQQAHTYLLSHFDSLSGKMTPSQIIATASVIADSPVANEKAMKDTIEKIARDNNILKDSLGNKSLAQLAKLLTKNGFDQKLRQNVQTLLDNRITIDSRGAFLQAQNTNWLYDYYESTIGDTALYLDSLVAAKRATVYTDKIVHWILNSRDKDGAWGSTQNTLAVVRAFTNYLNWKKETQADFDLAVSFNGKELSNTNFNARTILDQAAGKVKAGEFAIDANNIVEFKKKENSAKQNGFYYDMGLKYYLSGIVGPRDEGFSVSRSFYAAADTAGKTALTSANAGDVIREHLEITLPRDRRFVTLEDYIPAGMEIVDMDLATEQKSLRFNEFQVKYNELYPDYKELRDDRALIYADYLSAGTYEFDYYVRALAKGKYLQLPCVASEIYAPENFGRTSSAYFEIK